MGTQHDEVRRHALVRVHPNEVAHLDVLGAHGLRGPVG